MNVKGFHGYVMGEGVCVIDPEGFRWNSAACRRAGTR